MTLTYSYPPSMIEQAMERLKTAGLVSPDAYFNHDAPQNLRKEVAYRDFDFLSRLSRIDNAGTVGSILAWLQREGIVSQETAYDEGAFDALKKEIDSTFSMPGTSVTPVMKQLFYMLSAVKQPQRVIGIGTYCGYGLAWVVSASCGSGRTYQAETVIGIDIDPDATEQARENFGRLAHAEHVEFLAQDGLEAVDKLEGPFDCVFLDADSREQGKGLYLPLMKKLYGKVAAGGWVLAHDVVVPPFVKQLEGYMGFVRDNSRFSESILFDVDAFGLELSIK